MTIVPRNLENIKCDCMQDYCPYCSRKFPLLNDFEFITFQSKSEWKKEVETIRIMEKSGKGFARVYWYLDDPTSIYLDSLGVIESYRNNGLGRRLQEMREEIGRTKGATHSYLFVLKGSWMEEWYKRRGYSYYKEYELLENNIWMVKELI